MNFRNGDPTYVGDRHGPDRRRARRARCSIRRSSPTRTRRTRARSSRARSRVWRTQDWGGDQAYLEANCPEFTTACRNPNCGDFVRIGPPGVDRPDGRPRTAQTGAGGTVAAIERAPSNTGTMWAATIDGSRLHHRQRERPGRRRLCGRGSTRRRPNDPSRFVSSIYVDPTNANHAWISYSGYNINTPTTPGSRVRGHPDWRHGDVDRPHVQPGRSAGHGSRPRRPDRRPVRGDRLRRHAARGRLDDLDGGRSAGCRWSRSPA